jgi:hypothetical protein
MMSALACIAINISSGAGMLYSLLSGMPVPLFWDYKYACTFLNKGEHTQRQRV